MRNPLKQLGRFAAIVALGSAFASAQSTGFDTQLKLRAGFALGDMKDQLNRQALGAGIDFGYTFSFGRIGLEAGYQYKTGDQYGYDVSKAPVLAGTTVDMTKSADLRRNSMEGITARLSYSRALPNTDMGFQLGVQLGGAKFRHEYVGNVAYGTVTDAYLGTPSKNTVAVSPYAGLTYNLSPNSSLEANVILVSYKAIDYVHVAGTGTTSGFNNTQDYLRETSRLVPHIEIGYAFRF